MPARDDIDMSDVAEAAHDAGVSHYLMLSGIRQGLINMFAAGMYHTFEQQLLQFHRKEMLTPFEDRDQSLFTVPELKRRLLGHEINIEDFSTWKKLDELRLVANTVKHAEGKSADELRAVRPDLFDPPNLKEMGFEPNGAKTSVFLPLVGEDLFVHEDGVREYRDAIIEFWNELLNALERV